MFWFFGHEHVEFKLRMWNLSSPTKDRTHNPPAMEGEVLTTGPPGSPSNIIFNPLLKNTISPHLTGWGGGCFLSMTI